MSFQRPLPPSSHANAGSHEHVDLLRRQREAERWAQVLGASLAQPVEKSLAIRAQSEPTPTGWQGSDGSMTQSEPTAEVSQSTETTDDAPLSRIRLDVQAGDLGEVALVVDRSQGGVRVFIGIDRDASRSLIEPERAVLEQALRASGLSVRSVEVVRSSALGTVLAVGRERQRFSDATEPSQKPADEDRKRRNSRRLNLIG